MPSSYAVWLDRDVLSASGPEAEQFLQGQLSQDVVALGDGSSAWSWVLAPAGKVDALVRVTRRSEGEWLIETDGGWGDAVLTRLTRFKLRTKVELAPLPWSVLGLRGSADIVAAAAHAPEGARLAVDATWPGWPGLDLLGPEVEIPAGWRLATAQEYEVDRILAGIPRMGYELDEKTIPAETGLVDRTVSFTKGCYTGQELVARIDSRGGHVPRHLRRLELQAEVKPGAALVSAGAPAGSVTSVAFSDATGWVGLGYVRRAFEPPVTLEVDEGGEPVEVRVRP